jgi:hypothetical protein
MNNGNLTQTYPVLTTKTGNLTPYAFACGYIQTKTVGGCEFKLYRDGAVWHVQGRDDTRGRFLWECFDLLTPARAFFRKAKG